MIKQKFVSPIHTLLAGCGTSALTLLADGQWVAIVAMDSTSGGLTFSDGLFAVRFNTAGEVLASKRLAVPEHWDYMVEDLEPTADSCFVLSVRLQGCDFGARDIVLQKVNAQLQSVWYLVSQDTFRLPYQIEVAPDGNLIGTDSYRFYKINQYTGAIIWQTPYNYIPQGNGYQKIDDFKLLPGTEGIVAVGFPTTQIWLPASGKYSIAHTQDVLGESLKGKISRAASGQNFFISKGGRELYRFTDYAPVEKLKAYPFEIQDFSLAPPNLFLLASSGDTTMLLKTDFNGNILDVLSTSTNRWLKSVRMAQNENAFAIAGLNGSGPEQVANNWYTYNAQALWLRTIAGNTLPAQTDNAALIGVVQGQVVQSSVYAIVGGDTLYQMNGGAFKVQVKNTGSEVLNSLDVITMLDWEEHSICFTRPSKRQHYKDLALKPGDSMWLDFGDIKAQTQPHIPTQICFWIASPNDRPDQQHDDDIYCTGIGVLLDAPTPVMADGFKISPNPASQTVQVTTPVQQTNYQIFDLLGQAVEKGTTPNGQLVFEISVAHLMSGVYWIKGNDFQMKMVVVH